MTDIIWCERDTIGITVDQRGFPQLYIKDHGFSIEIPITPDLARMLGEQGQCAADLAEASGFSSDKPRAPADVMVYFRRGCPVAVRKAP